MAGGPYSPLLRMIRKLAAPRAGAEVTDGALLERFVALHDESAFTVLVQRHGAMVLGVCRSILQDAHDADDVFQAVFLTLVRKANDIGKPDSVGSWLHGVAYRLSVKARCQAARRRTQERQAPVMTGAEPDHEAIWRDLRPVLHEEVNRLPERWRKPFVLCHLEGRTNEEAADILGWPKGTVLSSLARARARLRDRLSRRGVGLSAGMLATLLAQSEASAAVPSALLQATVASAKLWTAGPAAVAGISAQVLAHSDGMVRGMFLGKLARLGAALLLTTGLVAGTGVAVHHWRSLPATAAAPPTQEALPAADGPEVLVPPAEVPSLAVERGWLHGVWQVSTGEQFGKPEIALRGDELTFTDEVFTINARLGEVRRIFRRGLTGGQWRIDPKSAPRQLDLLEKGRTLRCIYRLDGDQLILCVGDPDVPGRPERFETSPSDRRLLLTLQRRP